MNVMLKIMVASIVLYLNCSQIMASEEIDYAAEYEEVNHKMHSDMNISYTKNPDVDFVKSMIPHHKGALEMAKIQLKYGKDPEIIQLAKEIITAQEKEIKMMENYLKKNEFKNTATMEDIHKDHH